MRQLFLILLFLTCGILAEDKNLYDKKGAAWKQWRLFVETVLNHDTEKAQKMISGQIAKELHLNKIDRLAEDFSRNPAKFIREFASKDKSMLVLILNIDKRNVSLIFKKNGNNLTLDSAIKKDLKNPEEYRAAAAEEKIKSKLAMIKSKLKQIGTSYAMYFTEGLNTKIPHSDAIDIDPEVKSYINPHTNKPCKFLFIKPGYDYSGSHQLLIAVTEEPILERYYAVFEDGHVDSISKEDFKNHSLILDTKLPQAKFKALNQETQNEIKNLVTKLGNAKYKERKAAQKALLKKGQRIIPYLKEYADHKDFEIKVSIQELIKELEQPAVSAERPKL